MKRQHIISVILIVTVISMAVPLSLAAETLAPPTASLPANWEKTDETAYPNEIGEHDPAGAGMIEFTDNDDYDVVRIYYEKAQVSGYTATQLQTQAVNIFETYDSSETLAVDENGTHDYAGVSAGFAKGYDSDDDTYTMELVLIKNGYFMNIHAYYDATTQDQNQVESLINSISVSGAAGSSFIGSQMFWVIIIAVVAVVVVIVVIVVVMKSRKKQPQQATPQYNYPPPPPPPQ